MQTPRHRVEPAAPTARQLYRRFCLEQPELPLFARDWWLDASAGADGWDVALAGQGGLIAASMPYAVRSRYGFRLLSQPALTFALGPWIAPGVGKPGSQLARDKELMQELIAQLPRFDHFSQTWQPARGNWKPFYWNGFRQTTFYTYVLHELGNTEKIWQGMRSAARRDVNKASQRFQLKVRLDLPLEMLLELNRKTFQRQGLRPPYSDDFVRRIHAACQTHGCSQIFIAVDPAGVPHAGCLIVWDRQCAYGLISGADPALRNSGAASLCFWESLQFAAGVADAFNFAGSMSEPLDQFLRSFGGQQLPYFHLTKTPSRLLRLRQGCLSVLGEG